MKNSRGDVTELSNAGARGLQRHAENFHRHIGLGLKCRLITLMQSDPTGAVSIGNFPNWIAQSDSKIPQLEQAIKKSIEIWSLAYRPTDHYTSPWLNVHHFFLNYFSICT